MNSFLKSVKKNQVLLTRITGTLQEDQSTFFIISRSGILIMRKIFRTKVVEKIKAHILCSVSFCKNRAVYEIMWKNMVQPGRPQITIWRMRTACWINKATNTHSQYVVLIAFPFQQWLPENECMLR
jgi:hypothetical protein